MNIETARELVTALNSDESDDCFYRVLRSGYEGNADIEVLDKDDGRFIGFLAYPEQALKELQQ
jgi:hypothetical protein